MMTHTQAINVLKRFARSMVSTQESKTENAQVVGLVMPVPSTLDARDFFAAFEALKRKPKQAAARAKRARKKNREQPSPHSDSGGGVRIASPEEVEDRLSGAGASSSEGAAG